MDVVLLSRLQFAVATMFHFLFVPFTLGLSFLVAYMETKYVKTGDETYLAMTKFWGKLFLINFAVGVVTGITLEFQFGTNWSRYSAYVGDIFGSLLAIEATAAFFFGVDSHWRLDFRLEETFQKSSCHGHVAGGLCVNPICGVDSHRQCLDAESRRFYHSERKGGTGGLCCCFVPEIRDL